MDFKKIIIELLGLQDVWIKDFKIFKKQRRIEVSVKQNKKDCFCSHCGLQFDRVKDWDLKVLRAPPLGIYQHITIKFYQMRGVCEDCNKTSVAKVSWIHPKFDSMTCGFGEVAGRLMEEITCEAVGRILFVDPKQMWKLDQYRMEVMMQYLKLPEDLDVSELCADEVHSRTEKVKNRKGLLAKRNIPQFITNVVCPSVGKVLCNADGRDSNSLKMALSMLSPGQLLTVERFAVDMHDPFILTIKTMCPNAEVIIDRFHLAQQVNRAFDQVRRQEFKAAKESCDSLSENMLEPHRRFILMARFKDLSTSEIKLIDKLRMHNKKIHEAMLLVEYFHKTLDQKNLKKFREWLARWYIVCRESKLEPFLRLAKTIRKYRKNIEGYITSRLTTGVIEGINNKIKVLKRMGYGYKNMVSFKRKILQRCGYLNHYSINTDTFFTAWPHPAKSRR